MVKNRTVLRRCCMRGSSSPPPNATLVIIVIVIVVVIIFVRADVRTVPDPETVLCAHYNSQRNLSVSAQTVKSNGRMLVKIRVPRASCNSCTVLSRSVITDCI